MSYKEKPQIKLYEYQNSNFVLKAIIDDYAECSFENNRFQAGKFSITINYNIPNALLFKRGLFVQFGNNPYNFGEIFDISDSIGSDGKGSQIRNITGYDIRYIFKRRVIKNLNNNDTWSMTAKGELCMRNLIQDQCGINAEEKRRLPVINTIPTSENAIGSEYSVSESFSNLYDVLTTIATQTEIGWRLNFNGTTLTLEFYLGEDKHTTVRFDTDYESLSEGKFTDSSSSFANAIFVGGKGTGSGRDIYEGENAIEGNSPSGLDRFEAWDNQSEMTTEEDYAAEALSMLSQYGQTLQVSGKGLAKCPYEYRKEYEVGDVITIAFSGKSAIVQILSVTEHWTFGNYNLDFEFGKPQPDLNQQLQLLMRKIQKASSKTNSTESVKWYTIPTDSEMPSSDVTFNTIGFTGTLSQNRTFTFYLDNEKTGAKNYTIYLKNLSGNYKLILTTGKSGATNIELSGGVDTVAKILIDESGNIVTEKVATTSVVESGNELPVTSDGVAQAIAGIGNQPNVSNATGILPVANGGTGQTDLADVNVGSASTATRLGPIGIDNIRIGSAQAKITLEQLMTWFITTKAYIPSGISCFKTFRVPWSYADNDILQLSIDGNSYELQLAGCIIEFFGNATNYNSGVFRLRIHSSPTLSFTATSGYFKFPVNHIAEYTCNGSNYSPAWKMILEQGDSARAISGTVTCSTAAGTAAKTVTLPGFRLTRGARLSITLSNANTVASELTLNVNETGAKTIRWNGSVTSSSYYAMTATTYNCYYDGTYWNMDSGYEAYSARTAGGCSGNSSTADTTRGTAYCTTAGGTQAKVASMRGFVLTRGATFPITFTSANSYNGTITLNVNSTGAKNIYINNAVSSSSNKTLPAGTYLCRYDGSYYYIDIEYAVTNARNANYASSAGSATSATSATTATTANKIRTSAPSSPANGDIWLE